MALRCLRLLCPGSDEGREIRHSREGPEGGLQPGGSGYHPGDECPQDLAYGDLRQSARYCPC
jgi:hypothetical protein